MAASGRDRTSTSTIADAECRNGCEFATAPVDAELLWCSAQWCATVAAWPGRDVT
jgi:hypothetical protein